MNFITRAVLYTARKWKKTLLLFCLLLAITTLVLSGLAIADVQEEQAEEVRGTTGANFTVSRNTATGGWSSDRGGSYSTQEYLTADKMESIAAINGIEGYNASIRSASLPKASTPPCSTSTYIRTRKSKKQNRASPHGSATSSTARTRG